MNKLLAKALKDAVREKRLVSGARQVANNTSGSSLVILSSSGNSTMYNEVAESANNAGIPLLKYTGTSVALGKLCGLQFRISALSLRGVDGSVVQSIIKENEDTA